MDPASSTPTSQDAAAPASAAATHARVDPAAPSTSQLHQQQQIHAQPSTPSSLGLGAPPTVIPRLRHTSTSSRSAITAPAGGAAGSLRSLAAAGGAPGGYVSDDGEGAAASRNPSILLSGSTNQRLASSDLHRSSDTSPSPGAGGNSNVNNTLRPSLTTSIGSSPLLTAAPSAAASLSSSTSRQYQRQFVSESDRGFSEGEGEFSDAYDSYYAGRDRDKAARGNPARGNARLSTSATVTAGGSGAKGKRSSSVVTPAPSRGVSRARGGTLSRYVSSEDDDDDNDENVEVDDEAKARRRDERGRQRAMSPALFPLPPASRDDDEDDEVERRDRGEELVRKRMKDRARLKKEAEKAKKLELRAARAQSVYVDHRRTSYAIAHTAEPYVDRSISASDRILLSRRNTTSEGRSGLGRGSSSAGGGSGMEDRTGYRTDSTEGTERAFSPPDSPPTLLNEPLYAIPNPITSSHSNRRDESSMRAASIREDVEPLQQEEEQRLSGTDEISDRAYDNAGNVTEEGDEDAGSGQELYNEDDEDEEDDGADGDVEYTLKDRQDAINIEHPFGLPIWKPALYKKSRSVTRNAETALHAIPSSTVLRHLAPGNILWAIVFGAPLCLVCFVVSAVLWCVPWGGMKYGRVLFELGGYLFWPFGKYVEGWSDTPLVDGEDQAVYDHLVEEDEEESDEDLDNDDRREQFRDVEDAGKTFGRGRSRQASSRSAARSSIQPDGLVDRLWSGVEHPIRSPGDVSDDHDDGTTTPTAHRSPVRASAGVAGGAGAIASSSSSSNEERSNLLFADRAQKGYGSIPTMKERNHLSSSSESTIAVGSQLHDFRKDDNGEHSFRVRALGRTMYWVGFYLIVAPLMLLVCILCWGMVFTIPMAKLLWVLLLHLSNEPLSLHFRSPPKYSPVDPAAATSTGSTDHVPVDGIPFPLRAGQRAPRHSRKSVADAKAQGRLFGPQSTVLLCTYRAAGLQYYKYTVDGVNIMFINLLSLVFFVIADDWYIAPYVEHHAVGGLLAIIAGKGFIFVIALLSVIPLSYFIGMAVASISAQSSIGMGAVINASFGSIIEIILYCIALTQGKAELVEGSIVGSLIAGVLLMPGLSMIGGAMRRKEQRFNAKSAGVTSTMLIMAIIGILTPTLFYEIYGSFQLMCSGCDPSIPGGTTSSCKTCYYEHISPVDDPFYKSSVRPLSYYCATILVLSYLVGLWFSLRTHASQIWQNAQPAHETPGRPLTSHSADNRASLYKRIVPTGQQHQQQHSSSTLLPSHGSARLRPSSVSATPRQTSVAGHPRLGSSEPPLAPQGLNLPAGMTAEQFSRAVEVVAATASAVRSTSHAQSTLPPRAVSHVREISKEIHASGAGGAGDEDEAGGHDAPNWSRVKSASVLMGCTVLYAVIADILVDVVDVVLDGSGIPEKFLGVTLFALVPNTTEFMNAISFAINGNIALSMEIGSAYALQVCLIQAPVMLAFTAIYSIGKESMAHKAFTLVFPRWDVIAIIFSIFLLTYTYIEARANYYRGTILVLSYLVLIGGFGFAPGDRDTEDNPLFHLTNNVVLAPTLSFVAHVHALFLSLFTK